MCKWPDKPLVTALSNRSQVWAVACYTTGIDNNSYTNNTMVCASGLMNANGCVVASGRNASTGRDSHSHHLHLACTHTHAHHLRPLALVHRCAPGGAGLSRSSTTVRWQTMSTTNATGASKHKAVLMRERTTCISELFLWTITLTNAHTRMN